MFKRGPKNRRRLKSARRLLKAAKKNSFSYSRKIVRLVRKKTKKADLRSGIRRLAVLVLLFGIISYLSGYSIQGSQALFSARAGIEGNMIMAGDWSETLPPPEPSGIVLNELLPRPDGDFGGSNSEKPKGEWVELYNLSPSKTLDLAGYYLTNENESHRVDIETCRTLNDTTQIDPSGFLVVFRKGPGNCGPDGFGLPDGGGTVKLFDAAGILIDSYSYAGPFCTSETPTPGLANSNDVDRSCVQTIPKNKSIARIPDGSANWVDPIPTPGSPNREEAVLDEKAVEVIADTIELQPGTQSVMAEDEAVEDVLEQSENVTTGETEQPPETAETANDSLAVLETEELPAAGVVEAAVPEPNDKPKAETLGQTDVSVNEESHDKE